MSRKPQPQKTIDIDLKAGDVAVCGDPKKCLIAQELRSQGFHAAEATVTYVKFRVPKGHPRAEELGIGTWEIRSPQQVAAFIGSYDTDDGPQKRALKRDWNFSLDLEDRWLDAKFRPSQPLTEEAKSVKNAQRAVLIAKGVPTRKYTSPSDDTLSRKRRGLTKTA